ncbi:MAG: PA-phosphatase [Mycobacterium sp.]
MVLLGWAVGPGSTPLDDWFQRGRDTGLGWLLFFTDPRTVLAILAAAVGVALYRRRWVLALGVLMTPYAAGWITWWCKLLFGRHKDVALAYPSGHTTLMVVVLGMVMLVFGAHRWLVAVAIVFASLGMLGQAVTYHYFTDTVGGLLLGTSLTCLTALLTGVKRSPPRVTMAA